MVGVCAVVMVLLFPVNVRFVSDLLPAQEQRKRRERTAGINRRMGDLSGIVILSPIVSYFWLYNNGNLPIF